MNAPKLTFKPAVRAAVKLKVLIDGPSGSGKTFGALALAEGIVGDGRIALIDSEHERASFYADRYRFDSLALTDFHPDQYVAAIDAAIEAGYSVIVLDSLTHAWQNVLQRKEQRERDNPRANQFTMWGLFTPAWERLIQHILQVPVHIICTARSKQAYEQTDNGGKKQVVKLGLQPQVREGTEYEFGLVFSLEQTHKAQATKDNTNLFPPRTEMLDLADGKVAHLLSEWLTTAKPVAAPEPETVSAINAEIAKLAEPLQGKARQKWAAKRLAGCTEAEAQEVLDKLLAAGEKAAPAKVTEPQAPNPNGTKRLPPPAESAPAPVAEASASEPEPEPEPEPQQSPEPEKPKAAAPASVPVCPKCGGEMWDNRSSRTSTRAPAFKCKGRKVKGCVGAVWKEPEGEQPELLRDPVEEAREAKQTPVMSGAGFEEFPAAVDGDDDLPF